jgi:KUP system potassium uptake protein
MWTWRCGRNVINRHLAESGVAVETFLQRLGTHERNRVPGTAIFLARDPGRVPHALLHNLRHNKVLHKLVIFLTIRTSDDPTVPPEQRCSVEALPHEFYRVILTFGFAETPNIPHALRDCTKYCGLQINPLEASYFIGRETLVPSSKPDLNRVQEQIYIFLANNASSAAEFFGIPTNQVVELGRQLEV